MKQPFHSLISILRNRAQDYPHKQTYRFLEDGEFKEIILTNEELDRHARAIGAKLQALSSEGDRVLMLFSPGIDFIRAYFGCLYAKVMAVPVYPPHPVRIERTIQIIEGIINDADPTIAMLSSILYQAIISKHEIKKIFKGVKFLIIDDIEIEPWSHEWIHPEINEDDIAFLQYTSGSTTEPKGVMVSHSNLLYNMELIAKCFGVSKQSHGVIWLPPYHDMGLIGGILQPLYSGISVTLMPHMQFLQKPFRWLDAISRYKGTISGGPNFAFDLCVNKIKAEQRDQLDLSSWEVAFNGAEPVYHHTLSQFAEYFAPCGFEMKAFLPCYGLAESTLMVTGGPRNRLPTMKNILDSGLKENELVFVDQESEHARKIVSCGRNLSSQNIKIVNPETFLPSSKNEIGEIWVSGPSVTKGYWNKPYETDLTFGVNMTNAHGGPFLRSGDLGFYHEGELFITGRIKDLIITGGKNHYPHDMERTVERALSSTRSTGCAVFSVEGNESEDLIIVVEIRNRLELEKEKVAAEIREAISLHHGLKVFDIRFTLPGSIPRTTSGKIRRFLCKEKYINGNLEEIILS
jgi:acyl-CoA synthetase (AMP-forming)/AMP-acid ligase II